MDAPVEVHFHMHVNAHLKCHFAFSITPRYLKLTV